MMQAVALLEKTETSQPSQPVSKHDHLRVCSGCLSWQGKLREETKRNYEEIEHLRTAVQTLVDHLAQHIHVSRLHSLVEKLRLDKRLLSIPGQSMSKCTIAPVELPCPSCEVPTTMVEQEQAEKQLSQADRELEHVRKARESAEQRLVRVEHAAAEQQRRLAKAEAGLRAFEASEERSLWSPVSSAGRFSPSPGSRQLIATSIGRVGQHRPAHKAGAAEDGVAAKSAMMRDLQLTETPLESDRGEYRKSLRRATPSRRVESASNFKRRQWEVDDFPDARSPLPPRPHDLPPLSMRLSGDGLLTLAAGGSKVTKFGAPGLPGRGSQSRLIGGSSSTICSWSNNQLIDNGAIRF